MWRLWNLILGCHYVQYTDSATTFVARVIKLPNGRLYMKCGGIRSHYNDILKSGGRFVNSRYSRWEPLTWDGSVPLVDTDLGEL